MSKSQSQSNNKVETNEPTKTDTILGEELLTYTEAARRVGKVKSTIWRWVRDGLLPSFRHPSGTPAIRKADLERLYSASCACFSDQSAVK